MNPANPSEGRILVLEPDENLASAIRSALAEVAPGAIVDMARTLQDAQRIVPDAKPDLFVLDVDSAENLAQDFLYDLRTSHPNARAIILTGVHLAAAREQAAGLGAIHFLEKPFPHSDFLDLVQALLRPATNASDEKFQGTLSELHVADIIQLKCMSGTTGAIELTGPGGEKGRVYFEKGQVRHASAAGKEGMEAFANIVTWKGGKIAEIPADSTPRTIDLDWQVLLMEAMREADETKARAPVAAPAPAPSYSAPARRSVLVIDDSLMLLNFVREILSGANYHVMATPTAVEGLAAAKRDRPGLILLDSVLPDMRGDEFMRKLSEDRATAGIRVIYMSGLGSDLQPDSADPNVIGFLNKPFTSDLLTKTVETHMPQPQDESTPAPEGAPAPTGGEQPSQDFFPQEAAPALTENPPAPVAESAPAEAPPEPAPAPEWWSAPQSQTGGWSEQAPAPAPAAESPEQAPAPSASFLPVNESAAAAPAPEIVSPDVSVTAGLFFAGDTRFFPLQRALHTVASEKLTGTLRAFWSKAPVELLVRDGQIVTATSRDPDVYCPEAPITLVNTDQQKIEEAKAAQRETGCPLFITLAQGGNILGEPAAQLVQHYGQKLFSQLWTAPQVRFSFEQSSTLPAYVNEIPAEPEADHWALATLRLIQLKDLGNQANYDPNSIPAYTRDGFERIQNLRLTVAEAQFGSQFNGARSIAQIAKNLRLDLKFARLTLFRFVALDIVECWPPSATAKTERKGVFQRLLDR